MLLKLALNRNPLVENHGEPPQQVEHEHDTDCHQHNTGADFYHADVFTQPLEGGQELVKQQSREQKGQSQPQ